MNKKSQASKDWLQDMRSRGKGIKRSRIGSSEPSPEYRKLLEVINSNTPSTASPQDIDVQIRRQDIRYWEIFSSEKPLTPEWSKYGKKHFDRIRETISSPRRGVERGG